MEYVIAADMLSFDGGCHVSPVLPAPRGFAALSDLTETPDRSIRSDMDVMFEMGWTPGLTEMEVMRRLSDESEECGFVPSVMNCMTCDERPAQSRDESVFALCAICCEKIRLVCFVQFEAKSPNRTQSDLFAATHAIMSQRFGYKMIDAELSKLFD